MEKAFRVSKGNLEMRPIFHFTERRIEAHICICFVAYKVYKELERVIRHAGIAMSVDKVLDIAKTIINILLDKFTKSFGRAPQNNDADFQ